MGHVQTPQQQQQHQHRSIEVPHHNLTSSLPKHTMQPGQPQQKLLDREEGQQHGGILLSQLSLKAQVPVSSAQSSVQKGQEEAIVPEAVKPLREGQKVQLLSHSSQDQKQADHSMQHHPQSNSQPERQVSVQFFLSNVIFTDVCHVLLMSRTQPQIVQLVSTTK